MSMQKAKRERERERERETATPREWGPKIPFKGTSPVA
jgi:hypothetical protein